MDRYNIIGGLWHLLLVAIGLGYVYVGLVVLRSGSPDGPLLMMIALVGIASLMWSEIVTASFRHFPRPE